MQYLKMPEATIKGHGFLKVAAATPQIEVGDCGYNEKSICKLMDKASRFGASLLVLPELCITGYTCEDLFWQRSLRENAASSLFRIVEHSQGQEMITVLGLPLVHRGKLYNVAAVVYNKKILGFVPKSYIPNYSEFYEERHFTSGIDIKNTIFGGEVAIPNDLMIDGAVPFGTDILFDCENIPGFTLAIEICEDLWAVSPPSERHAVSGATVIANLSASDEVTGKDDYRRGLIKGLSARALSAYVYADAGYGESSTDLVFAAHNIIAEDGNVLAQAKRFENETVHADIDLDRIAAERSRMSTFTQRDNRDYRIVKVDLKQKDSIFIRKIDPSPFIPNSDDDLQKRCEEVLDIQTMGLKKRLEHTNSKTAVIGISGGLDSTLALLVTVRAFDLLKKDRKDIIAVMMPGFGTTDRTRNNASLLIKELGCTSKEIDITQAVLAHLDQIGHNASDHDTTYENAQARQRTYLLMDLANEYDGMVVGTGDMSELALGWATYNGDHMSMYGVNSTVPKSLVRYLIQYYTGKSINMKVSRILSDILKTPVTPELLPSDDGKISQKTEDILGPYIVHDFLLYYILRYGYTPEKVYFLATQAFKGVYPSGLIKDCLKTFYRRFFAQQFKRSCLPDGPKVGSIALSPRGDLRMPSDAVAREWLERIENI